MPNCLGLYIESNIIKYAKVSKEQNDIKVEAFGVKFYDKLNETLKQIINETFSYKIPISINLSEEMYNYFEVFSLLNKSDLKKALGTEFELFCSEKEFDMNVLESRYILAKNVQNREKTRAIYMSVNKTEIARKTTQLQEYKLGNISPLPIALSTLIYSNKNENIIIVNMEEKTTVTTIIEDQINKVDLIEDGMNEIFTKINYKENSFAKSYEVCKNTTIYTSEGIDLQVEESEYLEDIMPTLYNIISQLKNIIDSDITKIDKLYITGSGAIINNIDLYFQEYLGDISCEVLKPFFINNISGKFNVKDYIEVNSAIAMALQGLGNGVKDVNFKKQTFLDKLPEWLKLDITSNGLSPVKEKLEKTFNMNSNGQTDKIEKIMIRAINGITILLILYIFTSSIIVNQINKKNKEIQEVIDESNKQITAVSSDIDKIKNKTNEYSKLIKNLESFNDRISEQYKTKKIIPNLLNQIMSVVPKNVQITSIENTSDRHIKISAQAEKYEQLGYFKASLEAEGILVSIQSTNGTKQDSVVKVNIEGDIP